MQDEWYNRIDDTVTAYDPLPPWPPAGLQGPPPTDPPPPTGGFVRVHRLGLVILACVIGLVVVAVAVVVAVRAARPAEIALAVDDCVALESERAVEYPCANGRGEYRIVAREAIVWPVESACMKFEDVTRAVPDEADARPDPDTVLCLAPTRFNTVDPGALDVGDCVDVEGAGDRITRVPCRSRPDADRVVGTELHRQVPVTDQACRTHPTARNAYAHRSLGGRAIVVCTEPADAKSVMSAVVGDCVDGDLRGLLACGGQQAVLRVLDVRMLHHQPQEPRCVGIIGATAVTMTHNDKTDLVFVACLGPSDPGAPIYSAVGDCLAVAGSGSSSRSRRLDCADSTVTHEVIERHESDDNHCPSGTEVSITWRPGVTTGATVCLAPR